MIPEIKDLETLRDEPRSNEELREKTHESFETLPKVTRKKIHLDKLSQESQSCQICMYVTQRKP